MSLNETVSADRLHISFFGKRNAGKSSLVNAVTGQALSVVSDVLGTTTDPVKKAMEILPLGPVVIIDTPGFDDVGTLGEMRVAKTREILNKTDIAVLVTDKNQTFFTNAENNSLSDFEKDFLALVEEKKMPLVIAHNKSDLLDNIPEAAGNEIWVSATEKINIDALKDKLAALAKNCKNERKIVADLLSHGDLVVLVTPIDQSAPKGRLILPQQQTLRDILDANCTAVVCQVEELAGTLAAFSKKPKMVITDSQAFGAVSKIVPRDIPLTSFSILFARYKGNLEMQIKGASALSNIKDGDKILISEGCTHHRQCGDIGTVKLPAWIEKFSDAKPVYTFTSGGEYPADLKEYKLVVHCGGCMLNEAEMKHRISTAVKNGVPVVNYGMAIAHVNGILARSLEIFPEALAILKEK